MRSSFAFRIFDSLEIKLLMLLSKGIRFFPKAIKIDSGYIFHQLSGFGLLDDQVIKIMYNLTWLSYFCKKR